MACTFKFSDVYKDWLNTLEQSLEQLPKIPRLPLCIGSVQVGSVEEDRGLLLQSAGLLKRSVRGFLLDEKRLDTQFSEIAFWLHQHGMADLWRDELLSVTDNSGKEYAVAERAAARPLGITTFAVHLVGRTPEGHFWLQRRALHKSADPGLLDTLAGGLVRAGESLEFALERETKEEAGLILRELPVTGCLGDFKVHRPVNPDVGGYMVEHGFWYERQIPEHLTPVNLDGEVSDFVKLSQQELVEQMLQGNVAPIACLIFTRLFFAEECCRK